MYSFLSRYYKPVNHPSHVLPSLQAAGAALAYVGAYVIRSYDSFESFVQDKHTLILPAIIIGISVIMFIFGFVGCCATIRESKIGLSFVSVCVRQVLQSRFWAPVILSLTLPFPPSNMNCISIDG